METEAQVLDGGTEGGGVVAVESVNQGIGETARYYKWQLLGDETWKE